MNDFEPLLRSPSEIVTYRLFFDIQGRHLSMTLHCTCPPITCAWVVEKQAGKMRTRMSDDIILDWESQFARWECYDSRKEQFLCLVWFVEYFSLNDEFINTSHGIRLIHYLVYSWKSSLVLIRDLCWNETRLFSVSKHLYYCQIAPSKIYWIWFAKYDANLDIIDKVWCIITRDSKRSHLRLFRLKALRLGSALKAWFYPSSEYEKERKELCKFAREWKIWA